MISKFSLTNNLFWTQDAQIKLNSIPFLVRTRARQRVEELARIAELQEVTPDIVEQAHNEFVQE